MRINRNYPALVICDLRKDNCIRNYTLVALRNTLKNHFINGIGSAALHEGRTEAVICMLQ